MNPSRQEVYRGLLSAIGRYFYHYARNPVTDERVDFDADEPFRPVIDWALDGDEPVAYAFHVWGVGGGRGPQSSYDYCKDRRITWDRVGGEWQVETSRKYVINGERNAPGDVPTEPAWL